jgi:hypothetical protein
VEVLNSGIFSSAYPVLAQYFPKMRQEMENFISMLALRVSDNEFNGGSNSIKRILQ